MKKNYEVIIIGAGPAGAAAANELVKNGVKTLVIEKKKLPRHKPCDGLVMDFIYTEIEKSFGKFPKKIMSDPPAINGIKVVADHKEYDIQFSTPAKFVIRKDFDYWLITQSKSDIYDEMEFINVEKKGDLMEVICRKKSKEYKFLCKYFVGADGDMGAVLKNIEPDLFEKKIQPYRFFLGKIHYEGEINLEKKWWYSFLGEEFGALSLVTQKDNTITLENCIKKGNDFKITQSNLVKFLEENYNFKIKKEFKTDIVQRNQMASMGIFYPGKENILLAGEASGLLRLYGEGIGLAIDSGTEAAKAIIMSLNNGRSAMKNYKPSFEKLKKISANEWNVIKFMFGRPGNIGEMDPKKSCQHLPYFKKFKLPASMLEQLKPLGTGRQAIWASIKNLIFN